MSPLTEILVTGVIVLGQEAGGFSGATANIYLEDVTRMDADARPVARQIIPGITHRAGVESRIDFSLTCPEVDPRASYTVRVHIDPRGDGQLRRGDYISVQAHPVLTYGYPRTVVIHVKEIK